MCSGDISASLRRVSPASPRRAETQLIDGLLSAVASARRPHYRTVGAGSASVGAWITSIPAPRLVDLRGRLAEGILELRSRSAPDTSPVVIIEVPRLGPKLQAEARAFMARLAPDVGWGLVDRHGGAHVEVSALGLRFRRGGDASAPKPTTARETTQLFTDLNRWLLKILLYADGGSPASSEDGDRPTNANQLQAVAHVSRAKAYRFAKTFQAAGYLDERLRLRRVPDLLAEWLSVDRSRPDPRWFARSLFPGEEPLAVLDAASPTALAGGFEACRRLDLLHRSAVGVVELHIREEPTQFADRHDLELCGRDAAAFVLIRPRHPESVFRAARFGADQTVDPWQAALDVVAHPARGAEQAAFLRDWMLARRSDG